MTNLINVENCWKTYGAGASQVHAVCDVSLEVRDGEFLAITGSSGSGKSTLLNMMGAMDTPSRGRVVISGQDLAGLGDRGRAELRRVVVGTVFQSFNLLPTLNVSENIALPGHLAGRKVRPLQQDVEELLTLVGMSDRARAWPDTLSGGEMQRVAVARALVNKPRVLLADEPTGNLDSTNAAGVLELMIAACRTRGAAVVIVTHSATAAACATRVLTMRDGRLVDTQSS